MLVFELVLQLAYNLASVAHVLTYAVCGVVLFVPNCTRMSLRHAVP